MSLLKLLKKIFLSWETVFISITTLVMLSLYFFAVPFLELIELKAWDLHFLQRGVKKPSSMVAFVTIDEESVNREGRWPWPRRKMAELLKSTESYGAAVIGLDMGFFESDLKLRQKAIMDARDFFLANESSSSDQVAATLEWLAEQEDDDLILSNTLKNSSIPIVLGHFFYFEKGRFLPPPPNASVLEKVQCPIVRTVEEPNADKLHDALALEVNLPIIERSCRYAGSFNVFADPDGAVRRMPLVIRYQKSLFPSLALQTLAVAFPDFPLIITQDNQGIKDIRLGPVSIPSNNKGEILVNYYGPAYTFPHYSATKVLRGELPVDALQNRLIIIGNTTIGLHDMRPTPFSATFPGVELHCTVMDNIIQQNFVKRSERDSALYDIAAIAGIAVVFLLLQSLVQGAALAGAVTLLLGGYIATTHYFFIRDGLWLNHVYPILALILSYLGTSIHRYLKEEREKKMIRETFSKYVHPSVVTEMLANPDRLRLGGEKKELSVLFSDIRGFTTLSERLPADELVPQLNEYLTEMTHVVFDHHGTLDKYIGDAVMAIFGAPLPQQNHAFSACSTALDMIKTLKSLQNSWQAQGRPVLKIGIGINTGVMMVGNMGSEGRFDYTVLGDNVNLAARLEGLTKMYGADIVVSGNTWHEVKEYFIARELDIVCAKGKTKEVSIYQLMAAKEGAELYEEPLTVYHQALLHFRKQEWDQAAELFSRIEKWWSGDRPSRIYLDRCRLYKANPPGDDWTCVTILDSK